VHAEESEWVGVISVDDLVDVWRRCHLATFDLFGVLKAAESISFDYSDQARVDQRNADHRQVRRADSCSRRVSCVSFQSP
jgi:hypothetical protein